MKTVNPGYIAKTGARKPKVDAGPEIRCPKCKKILMEGDVLKFLTRCKHCGKWVFLRKA